MIEVKVTSSRKLPPFKFRWPDGYEDFEAGWEYEFAIEGQRHRVRHGLGAREVYGRLRVHTVTWLDGDVQVEGVESDDYPVTLALLSRLRRPGRATVRSWADIPAGYESFEIVEHRREIDARYSPSCLAVKIGEDDLRSWALHAWLRSRLPRRASADARPQALPIPIRPLPPAPAPNAHAVARALLDHAAFLASQLGGDGVTLTPDPNANRFVKDDAFAFLVAVIADMGIRAERAWALPWELRQRIGHLNPHRVAAAPAAIHAAVQEPPKLHRFVNLVPAWIIQAAELVVADYAGDASRLWSDQPTAVELRRRLECFPGIGQKKAAMAVEILARDLAVPLQDLAGSDVAYDVHLRRVFLRAGLAERDDAQHMIAVAQALHAERPGALDLPAWDIGRRWCHPTAPDCVTCPLNTACARLIDRGTPVRGT